MAGISKSCKSCKVETCYSEKIFVIATYSLTCMGAYSAEEFPWRLRILTQYYNPNPQEVLLSMK